MYFNRYRTAGLCCTLEGVHLSKCISALDCHVMPSHVAARSQFQGSYEKNEQTVVIAAYVQHGHSRIRDTATQM